MYKYPSSLSKRKGVTLVEVMIGVTIVFIVSIGIISTMIAGLYRKQAIREHNAATRLASTKLEFTKRRVLNLINTAEMTDDVTIDDRGTTEEFPDGRPAESDDVTGTRTLRFFSQDRTVEYADGSEIPFGEIVAVECEVEWRPAGKPDGRMQSIVVSTLIAPSS